MAKNKENRMNENCLYSLDLISKRKCQQIMLDITKSKILSLDFDQDVLDTISECCELTSEGRIEIYVESEPYRENAPEEFLELIQKIENMVGGFDNKSVFNWVVEFPHSSQSWVKEGYEWELEYDETDDYFSDSTSWEDPDWEDE